MIKDMPLLVFGGSFLDSFVKLSLILILIGKHNFYSNKRFWISSLILSIYVTFSYMITDSGIRTILLFLVTILSSLFIFKFNNKYISKIIIITFCMWVTMAFLDVICGIILRVVFSIEVQEFRNNVTVVLLANSLILLNLCLIFSNKKIRNFFRKLLEINLKNNNHYILGVIIISVIMFSIAFYFCHFDYSSTIILVVVFIMVVIYAFITIFTIREYKMKNKIQAEYDILLTNLSEYENLLDRQRIVSHENKNQLLVIKGLIEKRKDAVEYINSLVDTQYTDNEELIIKTNRIPSGGLKGLVYYKMLIMNDKKINVNLEVDKKINRINFNSLPVKTNQELCKVIGVFLDNAIQEVEKLEQRNINIVFEYLDYGLSIKISNNYGNSNINRVGEVGYTNKGTGHGYGLRLVRNIIENNRIFDQKTKIDGKMFSQIINLKLK